MESPAPVTLPTIHLNGTGAKNLEGEYRGVRLAIDDVVLMLERATCNARDFYLQGPGAYEKARAERDRAFANLQQVTEYVLAWEYCAQEHLNTVALCSRVGPIRKDGRGERVSRWPALKPYRRPGFNRLGLAHGWPFPMEV
jgi:hypothetical protein